MTNGPIAAVGDAARSESPHGIVFALSVRGEVLSRFDVGGPRYWGNAFATNVDDDPQLELVLSGSGGLDVIETRGLGPDDEYFQRRRSYQRLNVVPWAYEDRYFIHRGLREGVALRADRLVLAKRDDLYRSRGRFRTAQLTLPPETAFRRIEYVADIPESDDAQRQVARLCWKTSSPTTCGAVRNWTSDEPCCSSSS